MGRKMGNRNSWQSLRRAHGFTLIEVMVALVVIAFAMGAIIKAVSSNISNAAYLQERTLAHWVAMNKMAEMDVFDSWPTSGSTEDGEALMAGHEWHWMVKTEGSDSYGDFQLGVVSIEVRRLEDDEQPLATLEGVFSTSK